MHQTRVLRWHEVLRFTEEFERVKNKRGYAGGYKDIKIRGVYYREFEMIGKTEWKRLYPIHQKVPIPHLHGTLPLIYTENHKKLAYAFDEGSRKGNMFRGCHLVMLDPTIPAEDSMALIALRELEEHTDFMHTCLTPLERLKERLRSEPDTIEQDAGFDRELCQREIAKHVIEKRTLKFICVMEEHLPRLKESLGMFGVEDVQQESSTVITARIPVFGGEKELEDESEWYYDGVDCLLNVPKPAWPAATGAEEPEDGWY